MKTIDELIKSSETEKYISLQPQLWQRVEQKLDQKDIVNKKNRQIWILAASMAFLMLVSVVLLRLNHQAYEVEDLIDAHHPLLSSDLINQLHHVNYQYTDGAGDITPSKNIVI